MTTFVVIVGFATPIGAIITSYILVMRTHLLPRMLGVTVAAAMIVGLTFP